MEEGDALLPLRLRRRARRRHARYADAPLEARVSRWLVAVLLGVESLAGLHIRNSASLSRSELCTVAAFSCGEAAHPTALEGLINARSALY